MANTLFVLDLLPFVHAGHVNKWSFLHRVEDLGSRVQEVKTPTGGVSLVFNTLYDIIEKGDIVICSDRRPTIKQEMYPEYKANRAHNPEINVEKRAAEYILEKCNATVLYYAGYEADDIIYSIVKQQHDNYDEIYVYTGDSDLYFLVDDKVTIRPASSKGKTVTRENYEKTKVHGNCYRYNSITMTKICGGDAGDNIPPLPGPVWEQFSQNMYAEALYPHMGDKNIVKFWVGQLVPEALPQVDLVFPLDVPDLPTEFSTIDKYAVRNWGSAINNKIFRGTGDASFDVAPYVEEMQVKLGIYSQEVTNGI